MPKYIHYFCSRKINCCCHLIGTSSVTTGFLFFHCNSTFFLTDAYSPMTPSWRIFPLAICIGHQQKKTNQTNQTKKPLKNPISGMQLVLTHFRQSEPFPSHHVCSAGPLQLKDLLSLLGMPIQRALRTHEQPVKAE